MKIGDTTLTSGTSAHLIPTPPPDLDPRPPRIAVPELACDCHAHVFAPSSHYPFRPDRPYTPAEPGLDAYKHMLTTLGVRRAVIIQPTIYFNNDVTADVLRAAKGAWRGIAVLDSSVSAAELKRLDDAGFRGVRKQPRQRADLEDVLRLVRLIAPLGWHLQVHLRGADLPDLLPALSEFPVDVVVDHFGRVPLDEGIDHPSFKALLKFLETGRAWVKLSAPYRFSDPKPPYPALLPFARALVANAPERLVWGTDWPHPGHDGFMPNDGDLIDLVADWAPDPKAQRAILQDNPARLYGFPAARTDA
jgi:predicted TIM-barrel fold metal-dependent hydrolase